MKTATWIKTDGTEEEVTPSNGKDFNLEELQKMVGGYIQLVSTRPPVREMYINEEGLNDNLPLNDKATDLIDPKWWVHDGVRGDVVVIARGRRMN